jgi:hypothetical protein
MAGEAVICADGIAVHEGRQRPGGPMIDDDDDWVASSFLIDAREKAKPPLTPARRMEDRGSSHIWKLLFKAEVEIWAGLALMLPERLKHDVWWKLTKLYRAPVSYLPPDVIWNNVGIREYGTGRAVRLADVGLAYYATDGIHLHAEDGTPIDYSDVDRVMAFSEVRLHKDAVRLRVARDNASSPRLDRLGGYRGGVVRFSAELAGTLFLRPAGTASPLLVNAQHPLVVYWRAARYRDPLGRFVSELVSADPLAAERAAWKIKYLKDTGMYYSSINWTRLDPALRPPYRVFSEETGWTEITEPQILEWATIHVPDEEPFQVNR